MCTATVGCDKDRMITRSLNSKKGDYPNDYSGVAQLLRKQIGVINPKY